MKRGGGGGLFKLKAIAVFFAAVIPAVVWDWLFPAKFSVTFNGENHQVVCHFADPSYAAQFNALNHFDFQSESGQPEKLPRREEPAPPPPPPAPGGYENAKSFEDKTNPFRNLEDPRFKK